MTRIQLCIVQRRVHVCFKRKKKKEKKNRCQGVYSGEGVLMAQARDENSGLSNTGEHEEGRGF